MASRGRHGHPKRYAKYCWICKMNKRAEIRMHIMQHNIIFFFTVIVLGALFIAAVWK